LKKYGRLDKQPGTSWNYSSVGCALLADVVEKVSKISFPEYISNYICKPAGMMNTYVLTPYMNHPDSLRSVSYINPGPASSSLGAVDFVKTNLSSPW